MTLTADDLPEGVSLPTSSASATGTITDYALMVTVGPDDSERGRGLLGPRSR